jgi:hypothetical protein
MEAAVLVAAALVMGGAGLLPACLPARQATTADPRNVLA